MAILKEKQAELAEIEAHIQLLKDNIDGKNREFKVTHVNNYYHEDPNKILFY